MAAIDEWTDSQKQNAKNFIATAVANIFASSGGAIEESEITDLQKSRILNNNAGMLQYEETVNRPQAAIDKDQFIVDGISDFGLTQEVSDPAANDEWKYDAQVEAATTIGLELTNAQQMQLMGLITLMEQRGWKSGIVPTTETQTVSTFTAADAAAAEDWEPA